MSTYQRLKLTMRSPARIARRQHKRGARIVRRMAEQKRIGLLTGIFIPPPDTMWRYPIRFTRPAGPKYQPGDCRRNPDWKRRAR